MMAAVSPDWLSSHTEAVSLSVPSYAGGIDGTSILCPQRSRRAAIGVTTFIARYRDRNAQCDDDALQGRGISSGCCRPPTYCR